MLRGLDSILPYIQGAAWAAGILLAAYLLTLPVRRRFTQAHSESVESQRRSLGQMAGVLLSYLVFSMVVLLASLGLSSWLDLSEEPVIWLPYLQAWISFWAIHLLVRLVEGLFVESFVQLGKPCPLTRLNRSLLRLAIMLTVAFVLIRYQLGQPINVLLTSTAIVTGVIGFAMQGVLGNLLGGMSLHTSRSMSIGDWIEVDGTVGRVVLVNWRETRLRTVGGHIVIVPNSKLADQTLKNFSSPSSLRRHEVPISASYGDAPGDVIEALLEAAQGIPEVEKHPAPDAYVTGFKDFCIEYVLRFWTRKYEQRMAIEGNVMRMIWYKFQRRGIEIPFPMSGRVLDNFMQAVHAQRFEKPLASEIEAVVDDLVESDFGRKLMADSEGACLLSRDELVTVARDVQRIQYTHGETLMSQNDEGETFYVLVKGILKGTITHADAARNIEFELQPGVLLGEMSMLTGLPRSATIVATTDCELLEFDRQAFTRLLSLREEIPQLLSDLAATRTEQNAQALEELKATSKGTVELGRTGILRRLRRMLGKR